jgi:hypothetical protein
MAIPVMLLRIVGSIAHQSAMLIHVPQKRVCTFRRVVFNGDSSSACLRLFLHQIRRLKLVGLLSAGTRPLVAGSVGELVAVGRDEVVKDGGSTGACQNLLVYLDFKMSDFKLIAYRRGSPWG